MFQIKITMEAHDALHDFWLGEDGSFQRHRRNAARFNREEAEARAEVLPHRLYMVQMKEAEDDSGCIDAGDGRG
jgi:hypothetical protein